MKPQNDDAGAISIIMVLSIVVIFGVALIVVDAGALFQERSELQGAADAAALSVAMACGEDDCADPSVIAQGYAQSNVVDGAVSVTTTVDQAAKTVTVQTASPNPVRPFFGALLGAGDTTVAAQAVATWEVIEEYNVIPLIISKCELEAGHAGIDPSMPGTSEEMVILFHTGNVDTTTGPVATHPECYAQAGQDTDGNITSPGGFGWLESDDCNAVIGADLWVGAKTGNSPPNGCNTVISAGSTLWLAYFDTIATTNCAPELGGSKCYHLGGFFGFELTGFRFPGASSNAPCSSPETCIKGRFVYYGPDGPDPASVLGAENLADPVANLIG